ncbi:MAG: hypothetical protein KatS3mg087_1726 [Patescibacteria group bacterium]|nr:MAG: hypothetical protein KatS3mg087_1726 [Patescibacteria group bacterium]
MIFVRTMTGIGKGSRPAHRGAEGLLGLRRACSGVWEQIQGDHHGGPEAAGRVCGIMSADLLPSTNSLIPLFVAAASVEGEGSRATAFGKALRWFLLANWDGRYSGSAITSLNEDVRALSPRRPDFDQALESLRKRLRVPPRESKRGNS